MRIPTKVYEIPAFKYQQLSRVTGSNSSVTPFVEIHSTSRESRGVDGYMRILRKQ